MTVVSGVPGAGACSITGQSTAIIDRSVTDFSDSFNGKQNDSQNASSVAGQSMFSVSMDFRNFENDYRLWSKSGGTFPNSDQRSSCIFAGETCQIWDFRVHPTDLKLFKNNATTFLLSSDTCPTDVAGDQTARTIKSPYNSMTTRIFKNAIEDAPSDGDGICEAGETCFQRYLKNAQEILGDFDADFSIIGDDDGLCESHEVCLYSPYFGAYQGEGTFRTCEFQDSQSEVTNVTLYGYQ
jgi:hypothetical protein